MTTKEIVITGQEMEKIVIRLEPDSDGNYLLLVDTGIRLNTEELQELCSAGDIVLQTRGEKALELLATLTESVGDVMDCMISERLECIGWNRNGDAEPAESFFEANGVVGAYEEAKKFLDNNSNG